MGLGGRRGRVGGGVELLMMSSGIGGPLGGSWSCLECVASPTCRVLPFMKYLLYFFFPNVYPDLPKDHKMGYL